MGVHKEKQFEKQFEALLASLPRLDDAIRFAEHLLSESPDSGISTSVPGIYVFRTRLPDAGRVVRVSIFYLYDGKDVRFVDLGIPPPPASYSEAGG